MKSNRTILVTGFEPFGADEWNPTALILDRLPDAVGAFTLHKLLLPVEFRRAPRLAEETYNALSPAAVIMLGQAGGRAAITPETTAKNCMNTTKPDNAGYTPANAVIVPEAPETLPSALPTDAIIGAIRSCGLPAEASCDAGSYVCNCLFYRMLFYNGGEVPTGFIHVPFTPEQGHSDEPAMELSDEIRAVIAAIEAVIGAIRDSSALSGAGRNL